MSLNDGAVWNGPFITASKFANGPVSNSEFELLNAISTAILQTSDKGAVSGVCPLNINSIIATHHLPSSVSDIIEVSTYTSLPSAGDSLKIYVTIDNHKAYRWGGSIYVEISASLVVGTAAGIAYERSFGAQNELDIAGKQAHLTFGKSNTNS